MRQRRLRLALLVVLLVAGACSSPPEPEGAAGQVPPSPRTAPFQTDELQQALLAELGALRPTLASAEARDLAALYGGTPSVLWIDAAANVSPAARSATDLVARAAEDGLDPDDYAASELTALTASLDGPTPVPAAMAARFDVLLSSAVLRYLRHLHLGRVDPRTLGWQMTVPAEGHDFVAVVREAITAGAIGPAAANLAPALNQYTALKRALADYRRLAAAEPPAPTFTATVKPGEPLPDGAALHRLLVALGDLPGDAPAPAAAIYDDTLRAGVARFQERHGLEPDGVIGRTTQEALGVPLSWRLRQIELALERLRWLPDMSGRLIAVNIPMFQLFAWNAVPSSNPPALTMRVVVGRALDTRTPVFAERLQHVIFRPFWNVPTSIARGEILPNIRKTPDYLDRQHMELVRGAMDASPVIEPTSDHLARVGRDGIRIRQRPGPTNALGLVKFMFPNQNDVYMHDTPATQLFARARRDFSHGCIRVEDPTALASWVLGWSPADVRGALQGTDNRRVDLANPVQVVIFYTTAAVDPTTGVPRFATDVYRQDGVLDKAL